MGAGCRHEDGLLGGVFLRGYGVGSWIGNEAGTSSPLSLTLPREGGGDSRCGGDVVKHPFNKLPVAKQNNHIHSTNTPSPSTGEGWGLAASCPLAGLVEWLVVPSGGEQRTVARIDAWQCADRGIAPRAGERGCCRVSGFTATAYPLRVLPQRHHVIPAPARIQPIQPAEVTPHLSHKQNQKKLKPCAA
jgi:hypothetical protein